MAAQPAEFHSADRRHPQTNIMTELWQQIHMEESDVPDEQRNHTPRPIDLPGAVVVNISG